MEKPPKTLIDEFLAQQQMALAGYSHQPKKFGHSVYKTLIEKGYTIHPVNPRGGTTPSGEPVYKNLDSLPEGVDSLLIITRPEVALPLVKQASEKGFKRVWIQQMSGSRELEELLAGLEMDVVYGRCILLHAEPTGIHRFHRWILELFGRLPRDTDQ